MYTGTAKLPSGEILETQGTLDECVRWAIKLLRESSGTTINIKEVKE